MFKHMAKSPLKKPSRGYVAILVCITIPVLLLGVKYAFDKRTAGRAELYKAGTLLHKKCAREAALAVAKRWNPGLTLNQQMESLLKIFEVFQHWSSVAITKRDFV
jgi:hypothetical protein